MLYPIVLRHEVVTQCQRPWPLPPCLLSLLTHGYTYTLAALPKWQALYGLWTLNLLLFSTLSAKLLSILRYSSWASPRRPLSAWWGVPLCSWHSDWSRSQPRDGPPTGQDHLPLALFPDLRKSWPRGCLQHILDEQMKDRYPAGRSDTIPLVDSWDRRSSGVSYTPGICYQEMRWLNTTTWMRKSFTLAIGKSWVLVLALLQSQITSLL